VALHETRLARSVRHVRRRFDAQPFTAVLGAVAVAVVAYALIRPFTVVRYPPMTDLPMHAAVTSALRHWLDPAWHFQDQFVLHPLESPILTFYMLGALLALVLPIAWAVKLATIVMLAMLPLGLAVYRRGLGKDASLGVAAAGLAWATPTHWGFISFMGALGLTMMGLGLALRVVERPTRRRMVALAMVSVLLFFTHASRLPPYLLALAIVTLSMAPQRSHLRAVVLAVAPSVVLLVAWWWVRPTPLSGAVHFTFDASRIARIPDALFHGFRGPAEYSILGGMIAIVLAVGVYARVVRAKWGARPRQLRPSLRTRRAPLAALGVSALFLLLYFVLPNDIGVWSWVYPREITAAAVCALAALPSLPRNPSHRAPALGLLLLAVTLPTPLITEEYAAFDRSEKDFPALVAELPLAPKLGYIMLDRGGPDGVTLPLLHFPAWVQAERGGWLSFHFATWQAMPIHFRTTPPMDVAPGTPDGFEMHPELFDLATRGKYFDWILVRARSSPAQRMAADPSLHLFDQKGPWWLYHRE
jgi:hypothetical protein